MADIRSYVKDKLLDPLKYYPTVIQETLLELIIQKLETLYNYTVLFPEIVTPSTHRLDILKRIADQFLFSIRDEAELYEQIEILDNILYVYSKRGSIDTIENMWKYYGGDLPKDVQVIIPSYNLFRYSVSPFSYTHVFQDGETNHTGIYEIRLTNSTYPIPQLKEFLLKELVAAGNYIYFTNAISVDLREETSESYFQYKINGVLPEDHLEMLLHLQLTVAPSYKGLTLSGPGSVNLSGNRISGTYLGYDFSNLDIYSEDYKNLVESMSSLDKESEGYLEFSNMLDSLDLSSIWSGKENIFIDVAKVMEHLVLDNYNISALAWIDRVLIAEPEYIYEVSHDMLLDISEMLYCTPSDESVFVMRDLYTDQDKKEHWIEREYFILEESLLGESLGYVLVEGDN